MNLFFLTPEEKRVVAFAMLMILVGICVKEYRRRHPVTPVPIEVQKHPWMRKLPPLPSPSATPSPTPHPKYSRKPRKAKSISPAPESSPSESKPEAPDTETPPSAPDQTAPP